MSIEQSIFNRLTDDTKVPDVARAVKNADSTFRISPGIIDEGAAVPNISYETENGEPVTHWGGVTGLTRALILLNVWDDDYGGAKKLREAIRQGTSGLSRQNVGPHFINRILVKDGGDITYTSPGNAQLRRRGVQMELDIWYVEQAPSPL